MKLTLNLIKLHILRSALNCSLWVCLFLISVNGIQAQTLKFAFLTDLHVNPGSENDSALHSIVDDINKNDFDFAVVTGDLTNTGSNAELLAVKKALDQLNKPLLIIPGNHETNWSESAGLLFNQLWGNDRFVFHKNGFMLVGYNTGPFMKMGDGHVKQEDIQWLKTILKEKNNETLISFSHYPLSDGLDNWTDITEILKSKNCILSFCGHGHKLSLHNFDSIPGIMGRALKDKKGFGYNVVEINGTKVSVTEKLLGTESPSIIAFDTSVKSVLHNLTVSPKPNFSINTNSKAKINFELYDTASIFAGLSLSGDSLIIYGNSLGWVKAIRIKNKSTAWEHRFNGAIYSTSVITSNLVVFGTSDGFIKGLDLSNGKEKWSVNVRSPVLSEPVVDKTFVYIGGGDKAFFKINSSTGEIIWSFEVAGPIQGKAALEGDFVVFGAWDTHLYCLDKNTGQLKWKWNNGKNQRLLSPGNIVPVISRNKVFIVAPDRHFTALNLKTGQQIWRTNQYKVRESMGQSPDGKHIYAKLMNDSVISISASANEFSLDWAVNAEFGYEHNPCPVASNGKLVAVATKNGLVVVIDPKTQAVVSRYKIGNASINKLLFQGKDKLWITTTSGAIINLSYIL